MEPNNLSAPSLDEAVNCVCFNLRKAARAVTQTYDAAIASTGLKATQFTLMQAISLSKGATLGPLAEILGMDRTTLTRNLAALERRGLLELHPGEDRRERQASLTSEGEKVFRQATPLWRAAQAKVVDQLGDARWRNLRSELEALTSVITT